MRLDFFPPGKFDASRSLRLALFISVLAHAMLLFPLNYGHFGVSATAPTTEASASNRLELTLRDVSERKTPQQTSQREEPANTTIAQAVIATAPSQEQPAEPDTAPKRLQAGLPIDRLYYYPLDELDIRPYLQRPPALNDTPDEAKLAVNGSARIELLIEDNGEINAVKLISSDLPESYLAPLRAAFGKAHYTPGIKQGKPVRSRLMIEVNYVDGVINHLPTTFKAPNFPDAPVPHVPITLPPDWHKRKANPPAKPS